MSKVLIILRGLPGSGKSTFAKMLPTNFHFETDMFFIDQETKEYKFEPSELKRAHQWCHDRVQHAMHVYEANAISVSNTFTQEWEMEPYYKLAEQYGYRVTSLVVENRHGSKSVHNVPEETLDKMKKRFEIKL